MHINRIKECALLLFFSDVLEVTSTTLCLYRKENMSCIANGGSFFSRSTDLRTLRLKPSKALFDGVINLCLGKSTVAPCYCNG